jgi:threonine/homoserine/homoserine lactone efflux protein
MITAGNLAGYAVASFVLIAIPGPSVLFVIGRALSLGRGPAIASVTGNAVGVCPSRCCCCRWCRSGSR